jgi:hypothetical protein
MKWLKNKVIKWVREDWENENSKYRGDVAGLKSIDCENRPEEDPILTFRIYSAANGQVLEFRRWDRKNDRNTNTTYIIEKDKDIGEYVNKCLSLELLR